MKFEIGKNMFKQIQVTPLNRLSLFAIFNRFSCTQGQKSICYLREYTYVLVLIQVYEGRQGMA